MQMKNNPEVTVRSRGVMEKCSFCIQRIRAATAEATREGQAKDHFPDGAVVPACMEACPTGAITFGDVNAPGSRVAALAAQPARHEAARRRRRQAVHLLPDEGAQ